MTEDGSEWTPLGKALPSKVEAFDLNPIIDRFVFVGSGGSHAIAYADDIVNEQQII